MKFKYIVTLILSCYASLIWGQSKKVQIETLIKEKDSLLMILSNERKNYENQIYKYNHLYDSVIEVSNEVKLDLEKKINDSSKEILLLKGRVTSILTENETLDSISAKYQKRIAQIEEYLKKSKDSLSILNKELSANTQDSSFKQFLSWQKNIHQTIWVITKNQIDTNDKVDGKWFFH